MKPQGLEHVKLTRAAMRLEKVSDNLKQRQIWAKACLLIGCQLLFGSHCLPKAVLAADHVVLAVFNPGLLPSTWMVSVAEHVSSQQSIINASHVHF